MEWWLGYIAIGAFAGFFAGMLGIGGGGVMVPLLAMLFDAQGLAREHIIHLAAGTSMATILFTSLSSVLAPPVGAAVSHRTPTRMFKRIFGVLLFVLATRMLVTLWWRSRGNGPAAAGRPVSAC